ncbi:MAG: hypothetical protein DRG37_01310 [Deltaproteobacteria bacterium]|nr:MAG: hypothetical protein DRG37_01310 [Deltaproteobacteria bacterium]
MGRKGTLNMIMNNMKPKKATKVLAKTMYKELKNNGFNNKDIVEFSKELLDYLAQDIKKRQTERDKQKEANLLIG